MTPTLKTTLELATAAHAGQTDKSGKAYILHPIAVEALLPDNAPEEARMVALLHDVLEDTTVTESELRDLGYSETVLTALKLVSRDKSTGQTYMEWIRTIRNSGNSIAIMVKIADLKHNSSPDRIAQLPEADRDIVNRYQRALKILTD